jgi:hypothetical protein
MEGVAIKENPIMLGDAAPLWGSLHVHTKNLHMLLKN